MADGTTRRFYSAAKSVTADLLPIWQQTFYAAAAKKQFKCFTGQLKKLLFSVLLVIDR